MLIIAGHLQVDPAERARILAAQAEVVAAALGAPGCLDFSLTADGVDPARIRVYERWESEEQLLAFRGTGPSDDRQLDVIDADVQRYQIATMSEP